MCNVAIPTDPIARPLIGGSAWGRGPQTNRRADAGGLAQGPCPGLFSNASASA